MNTPGGYRGNRYRMGGPRRLDPGPRSAAPSRQKKRVLFVCIGNSCRSQMAEGFAKTYGADVLIASSAGLSPAPIVQPLTKQVLAQRNVRIDDQFPKGMEILATKQFDLVVNMSGENLRLEPSLRVIDWPVPDPIGQTEAVYQTVAEQIEGLVMRLIIEMRATG